MLKQAGISRATTVVIAGEGTADKVTAAQSVKKLNPGVRLVVVMDSAEVPAQFSSAHADRIIVPEAVAARALVRLFIETPISKELRNILELND